MNESKLAITEADDHRDRTVAVIENVDIQALITRALEKESPLEVMERLLAMRREMKAEAAREAYFRALAEFQAACPVVEKRKIIKDKQGKERYRYAPLDDIQKQIGGLLGKHGFSYTINTQQPAGKLIAICTAHHIAGHSETTQLEVPVGSEYMTAQQEVGAARTYAMRYAFCNAFGILTGDEDNDATTTEEPVEAKKAKPNSGRKKILADIAQVLDRGHFGAAARDGVREKCKLAGDDIEILTDIRDVLMDQAAKAEVKQKEIF